MSPERWKQIEELYYLALELDPGERAAFLQARCGDDVELRREVESLLNQDGSLFQQEAARAVSHLSAERPASIAGYALLRVLGEGGMGMVYQAEQQQPRRLVALKVIRAGRFAGKRQRSLFEREAELLGRLKHPAIATVYEAGETEDGQPYLAMELVEGVALDHWLEQQEQAPTRQLRRKQAAPRLRLFRQICDAIAHAHQQGVIHRDIKPSNIMVTADGVKVLDFGLARCIDRLGQATELTEVGMIQGSAGYMSPEQARGDTQRIDTRSDVYALGVLLYRLLTGRHPFLDPGHSLVEALEKTIHADPRPFREWFERFDEDLETIVRKALEKQPERRYQTVSDLAADLDRYLAELPIEARPPSTLYQIRMMARRHRAVAAVAGLLVVVLITFSVVTSVLAARLRKERDRANQEASTAQQVADFLVGLFRQADPTEAGKGDLTVRDLLRQGRRRLNQDFASKPELRARLLDTIAVAQSVIGPQHEAEQTFRESLRVRESAFGPLAIENQESWNGLCITLYNQGKYRESIAPCQNSVRVLEAHLGPQSTDNRLARNIAALAVSLRMAGDLDGAEREIRRAIDMDRRAGRQSDPGAIGRLRMLGSILRQRGAYAEAVQVLRDVATRQEKLGSEVESAFAWNELGIALNSMGEGVEAERALLRSRQLAEKIYGADHPNISLLQVNLSAALNLQGRYQEAERLARSGRALFEKSFGADHIRIADFQSALADALAGQGRAAEAAAALEDVRRRNERQFGIADFRSRKALTQLGCHWIAFGRADRASPYLHQAQSLYVKAGSADSVDAALNDRCLGEVTAKRKDWSAAERLLSSSYERLRSALGERHPDTRRAQRALAALARMQDPPVRPDQYSLSSSAGKGR